MEPTDDGGGSDTTAKILGIRKGDDSFLVEESGEHPAPDFAREPSVEPVAKPTEDTLSSEGAVNLDQGDPLAEADFHMAYGLYDQAADLVRIALDREPDRRDLRLKLLEIYFVWGNKDAFLQTAKVLEASRDRAPAGEWDKIVIMGKQICPDEPLFTKATGGGRGAGALVDLNLEGGENRIDIDLFGDPEGERSSLDHSIAKETVDTEQTGESPQMHASSAGLDFMLDAPERGADTSATTREMPPRDEPTVESEVMKYADSPTRESPAVKTTSIRDRISNKLGTVGTEQTAEVSIDDLGLDLEGLDETGADSAKVRQLEVTDHPDDAPTMVAGLDERSRRMMADAESRSRDRDLTELERELEASFISELESSHEEIKTAVIGPESAPTVQMPRDLDSAATSRFKNPEYTDKLETIQGDPDSTSKLRNISADSVDLDLDRLATALGGGDTLEQPRAAEEVFSSEVFEASQRSRRVDLDVGDAINGSDALTPGVRTQNGSGKLQSNTTSPGGAPEFEPVTMSEVGTKLDSGACLYGYGRSGGGPQHFGRGRPGRIGEPKTGSAAADSIPARLTCPRPRGASPPLWNTTARLMQDGKPNCTPARSKIGYSRRLPSLPDTRSRRSAPVVPTPACMRSGRSFISTPPLRAAPVPGCSASIPSCRRTSRCNGPARSVPAFTRATRRYAASIAIAS